MARKDLSPYSILAKQWNKTIENVPLTGKQESFAIDHVFPTQLIILPKTMYCSDCGHVVKDRTLKVCPHCGRRFRDKPWEIERSRISKGYFCLASKYKDDTQTLRFFMVSRKIAKGRTAEFEIKECVRELITPRGEMYFFRRTMCNVVSCYYDLWNFEKPIRYIGSHTYLLGREYYRQSLFCCATLVTSVSKTLYRNGLRTMRNSPYPVDVMLKLLKDNYYETLWKTGQTSFFNYLIRRNGIVSEEMKECMKICNRHGYQIKDFQYYSDYINLLQYFHLDIRNPHYICPNNLRREHDRLLERKNIIEERRAAEEQERREREENERNKKHAEMVAHWSELMGSLLSLSLQGKDLSIRPLQSIEEFKQEGKAMHHCVYACGYYDINKHPNTLILSAKDNKGNRLATIEYNTKRHEIIQCRAACNQVPERDKEIRNLITSHRDDIARLLRKEVSTKAKKSKKTTVTAA